MIEFTGKIGHLEGIESPWSNSGGVAKWEREIEMLAKTGVGCLEAGSFSPEKRIYQGPVYYNPETGEMLNRVEMDNCGIDEAASIVIPNMLEIARAYKKPLMVNVALVSGEPEEAVQLVHKAYGAGADAVLLNPDCPNLDRDPLSHDHNRLSKVLKALADSHLKKPIFIKVAPQNTFGKMNVICHTIRYSGICSAVYVSNSLKVEDSPIGPAGKSGPAMAEAGYRETFWAANALQGSNIDVVSCWGINNAHELKRRLGCKAVAGAGTAFFYNSENGWGEDVDRLLTELAA